MYTDPLYWEDDDGPATQYSGEFYSAEYEEEEISDGIENRNAHPRPPSPEVQVAANDTDIYLSESINQSKNFLERRMGIPVTKLSKVRPPGLIILRLEDFCQIRNVSMTHKKELPHIIVIPQSNNFVRDHEDFTAALDLWYPRE